MANEAENLYYGRRPSLGPHGGERGYRSRPGAPMADPNRNIGGASYGPLKKGLSTPSNWDQMFHNYVTGLNPSGATGVPGTDSYVPKVLRGTNGGTSDITADEQFGGGTNPSGAAGPAGTPTLQSLTNNQHSAIWSAPPRRGPDRSMPAAPFMPQDPSRPFRVPTPLTGPMGNAASDRAGFDANMGIYAPGGATGFWGGAAPQGWQGPTGRGVAPGEYTTPYGSARVDKVVPGTRSYGWGGSFEDRTA